MQWGDDCDDSDSLFQLGMCSPDNQRADSLINLSHNARSRDNYARSRSRDESGSSGLSAPDAPLQNGL